MICKHCHHKKANRPRGLCWTCYYRTGVRELYPSESKFCPGGMTGSSGRMTEAELDALIESRRSTMPRK